MYTNNHNYICIYDMYISYIYIYIYYIIYSTYICVLFHLVRSGNGPIIIYSHY